MPNAPDAGTSGVDTVLDEISREATVVGRQHGRLLAGLDEAFDALTPGRGDRGARLRASVAEVEASAEIDFWVPVESQRTGGAWAKRLMRSAMGFYIRFVTAQFTRFARAVVRSLTLMADDLDQLRPPVTRLEVRPVAGAPGSAAVPWWLGVVTEAMAGRDRPVLVSGTGVDVLGLLADHGVRAYGVDVSDATGAAASGVEIRPGTLLDHVHSLGPGSLAGALVNGVVPWPGTARTQQLIESLAVAVTPGGALAVVSETPEAWTRRVSPVVVDLSPGRPLHAESWVYLFGAAGLLDTQVVRGGADPGASIRAQPPSGVDGEVWGSLLAPVFPGPDEYVVLARLPH